MQALHGIHDEMQAGSSTGERHTTKGVIKLAFSWKAQDVVFFGSPEELGDRMQEMLDCPGCTAQSCIVQEWVDFDVEMRHFIVEPSLSDPQTWRPKKIVYTVFKSKEGGSFRDFDRYERQGCLQRCFFGDDAALGDAERQAEELIGRWLLWFQAQTTSCPLSSGSTFWPSAWGQGVPT